MLQDLTLRNFKIWQSTGLLKLAPVTLLLGTNSSGKSSIIQSLLLIRQTVRCNDPNLSLHLGVEGTGDSVSLGQFADILCRNATDKKISIEFTWTPSDSDSVPFLFSAAYQASPTNAAEISSLRLGRLDQESGVPGEHSFRVIRQPKGAYQLTVGNGRLSLGASRDFRPQSSFTFSAATFARLPTLEGQIIRNAGSSLLNELSKIIYLGPVRQLARRHYQWNGVPMASIGDDGGKAVDVLIASGIAAKKGKPGGDLFCKTGDWLQRMGLADGLEIVQLGKSPLFELRILREGNSTNLKDVGVGVSQVLPVIVAALHAEPGHIVLIEEPESHLHPLAQSQLAELFACVSRERNIQFIVETHSEHLFRRMQTLIARQEIQSATAIMTGAASAPPLIQHAEMSESLDRPDSVSRTSCVMYFVERNGNKAELRPLAADDVGRIGNWPEKFFGDTLGETKAQTDPIMERMRREFEHRKALQNDASLPS